jgi:hypothetical protein
MSMARAEMPMTLRAAASCKANSGVAPARCRSSSSVGASPNVTKECNRGGGRDQREGDATLAARQSDGSALQHLRPGPSGNRLGKREKVERHADKQLETRAHNKGHPPADHLVQDAEQRPEDRGRKTGKQHQDADGALAGRAFALHHGGVGGSRQTKCSAKAENDPGDHVEGEVFRACQKQEAASKKACARGKDASGAIAPEPASGDWSGKCADQHHDGQPAEHDLVWQVERRRDGATKDAERLEGRAPADQLGEREDGNGLRGTSGEEGHGAREAIGAICNR